MQKEIQYTERGILYRNKDIKYTEMSTLYGKGKNL